MDATIKATSQEVVLRVGSGSMVITRGTSPLNDPSRIQVWLSGGRNILDIRGDEALVDALCVLYGEAHNSAT